MPDQMNVVHRQKRSYDIAYPQNKSRYRCKHLAVTDKRISYAINLSPRYEAALVMATQLHASQKRKGTSIPYVSHLLAVSSLVLEHCGSEDQVIAALLHDAEEDQVGLPTLDKIRDHFEDVIAQIVDRTQMLTKSQTLDGVFEKEYIASIAEKPLCAALVPVRIAP